MDLSEAPAAADAERTLRGECCQTCRYSWGAQVGSEKVGCILAAPREALVLRTGWCSQYQQDPERGHAWK